MSELEEFVEEIRLKTAGIGPEDFVLNGQILPLTTAVLLKLHLDDLSPRFVSILGKERVEDFFQDYEPKGDNANSHLFMPLSRLIPQCCNASADGHVSLDAARLLESLAKIAECICAGEVDYCFTLRITNIDIKADFELADGIHFRKIPPDILQLKYPIDDNFTPIPPMLKDHWSKHRVEVVIPGRGKPADYQQRFRIEKTGALVNSILHTFLLAGIPAKGRPSITHVLLDSPIERHSFHHGVGSFSVDPTLLSPDDVMKLQETYTFLKNCDNDRVLQTAVDRFIVAKKRDTHHPNRVNEPNWDKIVDYVIAMETLFLTVDGSAVAQELGYRFRLNGSSLLRKCSSNDVRQVFSALKDLYELRSKVVHGCDEATVIKYANKFIERLNIDSPNHQHSLGRLMLVARKVDSWITSLLLYLGTLPVPERPFRKRGAWEEMLWHD